MSPEPSPAESTPDLEEPPAQGSEQPPAMAPVINNTGNDDEGDGAPTG
jgi:hypothetical protein